MAFVRSILKSIELRTAARNTPPTSHSRSFTMAPVETVALYESPLSQSSEVFVSCLLVATGEFPEARCIDAPPAPLLVELEHN